MSSFVESIRNAQPDERDALETLQRRASMVWERDRPFIRAHPEVIELPLRAIREGRVRLAVGALGRLGFSVTLPIRDRICEIDGLFVDPDFMGKGVGRALVADILKLARERAVKRLDVIANPEAAGFYEKMGFRFERHVQTRFGSAHLMHLDCRGDRGDQ